jgi:7-carboxy-7-deazaguanine synthase
MRIAEIYSSLQGEGRLAGTPSGFVRTSGCNLRCVWCDTPFTSWRPEGVEQSVDEVLAQVAALGVRHAVVTGGEPLLLAETAELCLRLRRDGIHVTIETAGTVLPEGADPRLIADLVSISPKLASSGPPDDTPGNWAARHEAARRCDDVLVALMAAPHQFKFVIDTPADLAEARDWLDDLATAGAAVDPAAVFLMPQGRTAEELAHAVAWLEPACHRAGFHLAPRHHIAWFGHARGT